MKKYPDNGCALTQIPLKTIPPKQKDRSRICNMLAREPFVVGVEFVAEDQPQLLLYFEEGLPDLAAGDLAKKYTQKIIPELLANG